MTPRDLRYNMTHKPTHPHTHTHTRGDPGSGARPKSCEDFLWSNHGRPHPATRRRVRRARNRARAMRHGWTSCAFILQECSEVHHKHMVMMHLAVLTGGSMEREVEIGSCTNADSSFTAVGPHRAFFSQPRPFLYSHQVEEGMRMTHGPHS